MRSNHEQTHHRYDAPHRERIFHLDKSGAMHITGKVKATMPADEPMETLLFATEDGALTPHNPHQQNLNLTVIEDAPKTLKTIDGAK